MLDRQPRRPSRRRCHKRSRRFPLRSITSTAMFTYFFITSTIVVPLLTNFGFTTPVARGAPVSQGLSPPPVDSGIYPDPELCHGNCSWIHDPAIVYEDGTYWRFATSGNIGIATAPFLQGPWTYRGALLPHGTSIHLREDQDIWAPTITKRDNTYYCHYSVSYIGSQHSEIGLATSSSLTPGTWTDHGSIGLPQNSRYNLIDPYVFQDSKDAPIYFSFGSYWSGIQQIEMTSTDQLRAWTGAENDIKNIISNTTTNFAVQEGAIMHKHEQYYYLFFSVGQCCRRAFELMPLGDEYHVVVCRADSITGPFNDAHGKDCLTENGGTTVLASHGDVYAPGGQGVMVDPKSERSVMYYHYGELVSCLEWMGVELC
ncbi:endo-1,5-alpha-L-arabinosidase [Setomelanomma holmii]|uniref:Endo-1,5-alpha-L-arabinanase A n=1 Tax=Setomelanomma holmii TaxID=210430 RepID=A0A9P4GZ35_9PLEO|nr:endo-1,5-alpha-L-arabinosidase [Setomelanomma holmii]